MSSSQQTQRLGLCDWIGSDTPMREDFCSDNHIIDEKLGSHLVNTSSHLSADDRLLLSSPVLGSYTGDGKQSRTVALGFKPRFGVVYAKANSPLIQYSPDLGYVPCAFGFFSTEGCSLGLSLTNTGFTAQYYSGSAAAASLPWLNCSGTVYFYAIWR